MRVRQISKNGLPADFEHFSVEARSEAFGLGIILAIAAATLRAQGLVVVQQITVSVAAILSTPIGAHE